MQNIINNQNKAPMPIHFEDIIIETKKGNTVKDPTIFSNIFNGYFDNILIKITKYINMTSQSKYF